MVSLDGMPVSSVPSVLVLLISYIPSRERKACFRSGDFWTARGSKRGVHDEIRSLADGITDRWNERKARQEKFTARFDFATVNVWVFKLGPDRSLIAMRESFFASKFEETLFGTPSNEPEIVV